MIITRNIQTITHPVTSI